MRLQYALYERAEAGYRWTWRAPELSDALLDDFVYRIELPTDANSIRPDDFRGGICKFGRPVGTGLQEHAIFYRFFDGGSDAGRPNRVVMLAAWTTPAAISAVPNPYGIMAIFRNKMFEYVSEHSRTVGIPAPHFWDSLTAGDELPPPQSQSIPPAVFVDLIEGLADEDNDSYLRIMDNEFTLMKKPSVAFGHKKKERAAAEEQRKAAESLLEREVTLKHKAEQVQRTPLTASRQRDMGGDPTPFTFSGITGMPKITIPVAVALLAAILVAFTVLPVGKLLFPGAKGLSREADEVKRLFERLSSEEQAELLTLFKDLVRRQQHQSRQPSPPTVQ